MAKRRHPADPAGGPQPAFRPPISARAADTVLGQAADRCNAGARVLMTFGHLDTESEAFVLPGIIDTTIHADAVP